MPKWENNNVQQIEKHPYVSKIPTNKDMSDGQKEWTRLFNSMREFIIKLGRMEEK